ncbi:hypothetical protein AAC387_Pa12g1738 [Persea americana]
MGKASPFKCPAVPHPPCGFHPFLLGFYWCSLSSPSPERTCSGEDWLVEGHESSAVVDLQHHLTVLFCSAMELGFLDLGNFNPRGEVITRLGAIGKEKDAATILPCLLPGGSIVILSSTIAKKRLRRITGDTTWREYTKYLQRKHAITLLLGPPGCGKTTLLRALAGSLDHSLQVEGDIRYNGFGLDEFVPQKTSVYVNQYGLHIPEMTVRETLEFSAHCQGVGSRAELLMELERREQERGILPDSDLDTYRKAASVEDSAASLQTDYILKVLGLDSCLGVIVGDAMRRGVSGGEKKRVTLDSSASSFYFLPCIYCQHLCIEHLDQ